MRNIDAKEIAVLKREKNKIIGIIILSIIIGIIYTFNFVKPEYETTTTLILTNSTIENNSLNFDDYNKVIKMSDVMKNTNLFSTCRELIKSNTLLEELKNNLNMNINTNDLRKLILVDRINNTELIKITVRNENSKLVSNVANEIANIFSEKVKRYYNVNAYVVDPAIVQNEPYNINHALDIMLFLGIGILISIIYLIIVTKIDTTIKNENDIENEVGVKTLISIPFIKRDKKSNSNIANLNQNLVVMEAYKKLRTNVQFTNINSKSNKVMLVTSSFSLEGKSEVISNLAISFADAGKKVILIDTDMQKGNLSKIFNIPNDLGISNYLAGLDTNGMEINERINSYIKETGIKNLNLITSGTIPPNPRELLENEKIYQLIKDLSVFYDLILLDGAPIFAKKESLILSRIATSTILVTLYNKTKKEELQKSVNDINNAGGKVIGIVLNEVKFKNSKNEKQMKNKIENITIFKKDNFIKKIKKIKEKIFNFFNNVSKREVKLLESEESKKEENIKLESLENRNYQISEEYIKENINKDKKDVKEKNIKNENTNETIKENIVNSETTENKINIKQKISLIKDIFLQKIVLVKEKIEEKNKKIKMQDELENQRKEEIKKTEQFDKKQDNEIKEKEAIEAKKRKEELEKIKQAENIAKTEQEKIIKEKKEQEKKEIEKQKIEEKQKRKEIREEQKNKRKLEKEEKKKFKEEEKIKRKEEARIKEEISEDNLYPKTKYDKNL